MSEKTDRQIEAMEKNQVELRKSIELTKTLSGQADKLLQDHKKTLAAERKG